jgi:uncharacterized damage-inducible protein DinB
MVSPSYIVLLFDFHYWSRDRVLDAAAALSPEQYTKDLGSSFKSVRDTLVHLLSAEWAWHERWQGRTPAAHLSADQYPDIDTLRRAWTAHEQKMRAFVSALSPADIDRVYEYKLLNGSPMRSPLWKMATHVVNHGSYHRGQVVTMLRQLGAAPPKSIDLIAYYRENQEV